VLEWEWRKETSEEEMAVEVVVTTLGACEEVEEIAEEVLEVVGATEVELEEEISEEEVETTEEEVVERATEEEVVEGATEEEVVEGATEEEVERITVSGTTEKIVDMPSLTVMVW
jgi:hypothetical protein